MTGKLTFKTIRLVNGLFLRAAFGFASGWVFWQLAVPGWEIFKLHAVMLTVGGVICLIKALFHLTVQIIQSLTWARFRAQGSEPKADPIASDEELRAKGYTK